MFETTDELLKQIRLGEDSALELKNLKYKGDQVNDPHRDSMANELAAMANTANGVFVLGVEDGTRTVLGIPLDKLDAVETWVRGICNDLITPPPAFLPDSQDSSRCRRRCGTSHYQS
jgi:predicted HTH transcriptional regulator